MTKPRKEGREGKKRQTERKKERDLDSRRRERERKNLTNEDRTTAASQLRRKLRKGKKERKKGRKRELRSIEVAPFLCIYWQLAYLTHAEEADDADD